MPLLKPTYLKDSKILSDATIEEERLMSSKITENILYMFFFGIFLLDH